MRITIALIFVLLSVHLSAQPVWPGDVNNNGVVNHYDVLYFGLGYNFFGPPRALRNIQFQPQSASAWNRNLADSTDFKYLDCDGNGQINFSDTLAIRLNYGRQHGVIVQDLFSPSSVNGIPLQINAVKDSVLNFTPLNFSLSLGDLNNQVEDFYGVAFTLVFEPQSVRTGSFSVVLDSSDWYRNSGPLLDAPFVMSFEDTNGQLDVVLTKTNLSNAKGFGDFLDISCIIEDNLIGKQGSPLAFSIENILLIGNDLVPQAVQKSADSVVIISNPIQAIESLQEIDAKSLKIYPNPATNQFSVQDLKSSTPVRMHIYDLSGQLIDEKFIREGEAINIASYESGYYLLRFQFKDHFITRKLVKY